MKNFKKFEPFIESACQTVLNVVKQRGISSDTLMFLFCHFLTLLPSFDTEDFHCRPGCGYCCHTRVSVSMAEVLIILDYLNKNDLLNSYKERGAALSASLIQRSISGNSWWVENAIPCLFYDAACGLCSIYEVRPFSCRAYHSLDSKRCKAGYVERIETGIPCYPDFKRSRELFSLAFDRGLTRLGLQSGQFELSSTVCRFLQSPDLTELWIQGREVIPVFLPPEGS